MCFCSSLYMHVKGMFIIGYVDSRDALRDKVRVNLKDKKSEIVSYTSILPNMYTINFTFIIINVILILVSDFFGSENNNEA